MALVSAALVLRTNRTLSLWAISAGLRGGLSRSFGPVQSLSAFCSALGVLLTFLSTLLLLEPQMWRVHLVQGETGSDVLHQPRCGPASSQTVVSERKGSVVTIGINRPEARNAVNQETAQRLLEEFTAFDGDPDLTVAVLHGIGGNFCAGYDLKELAHQSASLKLEQDVSKGPGPMGPSRLLLSKPLLAAVSGYAVAGGLELALCADIRVVEQSAVMGVFCRRFGVPLIDGGTVRLPCLIGLSRALDLILTGRPIGAQEALAFGLANRVVPDGQALQAALELAEQISNFPQQCLRADRASAYHSALEAPSFREAMQYEFDHSVAVLQLESVAGAARFSSGTGRGGAFPTGSTHDNTRAK